MERVDRRFYPDGTLQEEVHFRGNKEHGPWRRWHPNGVLAEEFWFENGIYANGVNRTWDANGTLQSEVPWVNGQVIGRMTTYDHTGSILTREYVLETGKVSRKQYEEACIKRPELPRYDD